MTNSLTKFFTLDMKWQKWTAIGFYVLAALSFICFVTLIVCWCCKSKKRDSSSAASTSKWKRAVIDREQSSSKKKMGGEIESTKKVRGGSTTKLGIVDESGCATSDTGDKSLSDSIRDDTSRMKTVEIFEIRRKPTNKSTSKSIETPQRSTSSSLKSITLSSSNSQQQHSATPDSYFV